MLLGAFYSPNANAAKSSCAFHFKDQKGSKYQVNDKFSQYQRLSLKGENGLEPNWLFLVEHLLKVDPKEFQALIPKELLDSKWDHEGNEFTVKNPVKRQLKEGFLVEPTKGQTSTKIHPKLFHMTSPEFSEVILKTQELHLSQGSKNYAAICLGTAGFPAYQNASSNSVFLEVKIKPTARILDLTYTYGDAPGSFSRRAAYNWYAKTFVPDLIRGKYRNEFPELTAAAKKLKKLALYELSQVEAFSILMGVDLIKVTERYEQSLVDEYWIIDPTIISKIVLAK